MIFSKGSCSPERSSEVKAISRPKARNAWNRASSLLRWLVGQWFLLGIGISVVLAWRWPHVAQEGGVIRSEYSIQYGAIALIFLITGLTLSTSSLGLEALNWRLHLYAQGISLLVFPSVVFALGCIIRAAQGGGGGVDEYILVGLVYMGCACTTIASNVSMSVAGGGSGEAAAVEVCLGNTLGVFFSPLLNLMFASAPGWGAGRPIAADGTRGLAGLPSIYRRVMMKMGLAMFVPMDEVGLTFSLFPKHTKRFAQILHLQKVSTFLLLLLIWSVFSTQFGNDAFTSISRGSVALVVLLDLALYLGFTAFSLVVSRAPFIPPISDLAPGSRHRVVNIEAGFHIFGTKHDGCPGQAGPSASLERPTTPSKATYPPHSDPNERPQSPNAPTPEAAPAPSSRPSPSGSASPKRYPDSRSAPHRIDADADADAKPPAHPPLAAKAAASHHHQARAPAWRRAANAARLPKAQSTALCFCAAAKGLAVAIPVLEVLYAGLSPRDRAVLSIPLVLYQAEQVAVAQILTSAFRRWNARPDRYFPVLPAEVDEGGAGSEGGRVQAERVLDMRDGAGGGSDEPVEVRDEPRESLKGRGGALSGEEASSVH